MTSDSCQCLPAGDMQASFVGTHVAYGQFLGYACNYNGKNAIS